MRQGRFISATPSLRLRQVMKACKIGLRLARPAIHNPHQSLRRNMTQSCT